MNAGAWVGFTLIATMRTAIRTDCSFVKADYLYYKLGNWTYDVTPLTAAFVRDALRVYATRGLLAA